MRPADDDMIMLTRLQARAHGLFLLTRARARMPWMRIHHLILAFLVWSRFADSGFFPNKIGNGPFLDKIG
jgi:hypothetical protein